MREPVEFRIDGLPSSVTIHEVGPRDGLQNEATTVSTSAKVEFIDRLSEAGLRRLEVTSLVRPDRVPQLADAEELLEALALIPGRETFALVPNLKGLERARGRGLAGIAVFASVTESFAKRNLNRTVAESLQMFAPIITEARSLGFAVRGYLSMCFGDPWEGPVAIADVVALSSRLMDMGCTELSIGDTIGVATCGHVAALFDALIAAGLDVGALAGHFHDTYGQALANTVEALRHGVTTFDSSAGGLGGCPFAKSASGNLATEDLVWCLRGLGIETGVDLGKLVRTSLWMATQLGRPSPSRVTAAMAKELAQS